MKPNENAGSYSALYCGFELYNLIEPHSLLVVVVRADVMRPCYPFLLLKSTAGGSSRPLFIREAYWLFVAKLLATCESCPMASRMLLFSLNKLQSFFRSTPSSIKMIYRFSNRARNSSSIVICFFLNCCSYCFCSFVIWYSGILN